MSEMTIKGSAQLVIKNLQAVDDNVTRAMARGLARGLLYAVSVAQRFFLSGPRPGKLDIRTRRLRDSVTSEVEVDKVIVALERLNGNIVQRTAGSGAIVGRMGTNVEYASFHELGFHGIVHVGAHMRVLSTSDVSGNQIDQRRRVVGAGGSIVGVRDTYAQALKRANSKAAFVWQTRVRSHDRKISYDGRPYIRPAFEQALPQITGEINSELKTLAAGK